MSPCKVVFRLSCDFCFCYRDSSHDCCFCCMSFSLSFTVFSGSFWEGLLCPALLVSCLVISGPSSLLLPLGPGSPQSRSRSYIGSLGLAHYGDADNVTLQHRSWSVNLVHVLSYKVVAFLVLIQLLPNSGNWAVSTLFLQSSFVGRKAPILPSQEDWLQPMGHFQPQYFSGYPLGYLLTKCT